jgi:hypothetical protein
VGAPWFLGCFCIEVCRWADLEHVCVFVCSSYAAAVILRVTYGKASPTSNDDPEVVRIRQVVLNFETALRPGAYLVDRIPWLKYVPGYGRQLKEFHRYELALFRDQLNRVRDDMVRFIADDRALHRFIHIAYVRVVLGNEQRWPVIWQDTPGAR